MANRANARVIHALSKTSPKRMKEFVNETDDKFINFMWKCAEKIRKGEISCNRKKLNKYFTQIKRQPRNFREKQTYLQSGGFIGALVATLAPLAINAIAGAIAKKKRKKQHKK